MTSAHQSKKVRRVSRFLKSNFGLALGITLAWKICMLMIGYFLDIQLNGIGASLLHHTSAWDAGWYNTVINDHYITVAASAAFYPLFPLLVGIIHFASFNIVDILTSGQIINTISVWFLTVALLFLGDHFLDKTKRFWLVALVFSGPAAFFMHVFYGEALFMAIGFWAYIFALKRQWLYMGILLAFLTATRLPALLMIGFCGLEFMRAYDWDIKKIINKKILYFLLAPFGFLAYGEYLSIVQNDFFAMFHAYQATNDWAYQVFDINIVKTILRASYEIMRALVGVRALNMDILVNHLLPIASLLLLGVCSLYLLWKKRGKFIPLGIFGFASIIMFTLNSNVVSVHRYVLPCLTVYIGISLLIKGKYQNILLFCLCAGGLAIQLFLFSLFITNVFAG